ncbi:MAG: hypothetical protein IPG21_17625 [Saprospiraceae bacterium]|nr:hypothetical protein [Candidatus Vicinibacter affinis]
MDSLKCRAFFVLKQYIDLCVEKYGIKTNLVSIGFEDKSEVLWITSKEGLYTLSNGVAKKITNSNIELGKGIGSVAEDKRWENLVCSKSTLFIYL